MTPPGLPPVWRDPWAWAVALLVLPTLHAGRGLPLGEPVSDDFFFLYERFFRPLDWLGGGGCLLYWRPLSRQLYYLVLGPLAAAHPGWLAAIQAGLLVLAGVTLYRALRPAWPAHAAAAAAAFPVALEASLQLVTWSSCAQDLVAICFGTLSLHALSRGRRSLALASLACALLSKETAIAFAVAMPLWPALRVTRGGAPNLRDRARLALGVAAVLVPWWLVHEWVSRRSGLLPPPTERVTGVIGPIAWALRRVWLETVNAGDPRSALAGWIPGAVLAACALAILVAAASAAGRSRLRASLPWLGWAAVWCALSILPIALFKPSWGSFRAVIPVTGLGIAVVALLGAGGAWAIALVSLLRLAALLAVPAVPALIPISLGSAIDEFDRAGLGSMQRLAHEVRTVVTRAHPTLPHGARVARYQWPRMSAQALVDAEAFNVWYRDSTLRVVGMGELAAHPATDVDVAIDFEPRRMPQVVLIAPRALKTLLLASDSLRLGRAAGSVALLADFEAQQPDTGAAVFLATGLSLRGAALLALGRDAEAAAALREAVEENAADANAHRLLAVLHRREGRPDLEAAELQQHLALLPEDEESRRRLAELLRGVR